MSCICFTGPKDVTVAGLAEAGLAALGPFARPALPTWAPATAPAARPRNRRRSGWVLPACVDAADPWLRKVFT
jgi:hypothetical protein